jgi:hypothetical protein
MPTAADELQSFYHYAELRLQSDRRGESLDEIYAEWRANNPAPEVHESDFRAVRASLRDMDAGNIGRPVEEFAAEFRRQNGL